MTKLSWVVVWCVLVTVPCKVLEGAMGAFPLDWESVRQKFMLGEIMSHLKACQHRELAHAVTESIVLLNYNCVCTNACARNIKMYNDVPICSRRLKSLAQSGHTDSVRNHVI